MSKAKRSALLLSGTSAAAPPLTCCAGLRHTDVPDYTAPEMWPTSFRVALIFLNALRAWNMWNTISQLRPSRVMWAETP